jgi:hypothetical protein
MDDRQALLLAAIANPDEDSPRLHNRFGNGLSLTYSALCLKG